MDDACCGPDVPLDAVRFGPLCQQTGQLSKLLWWQVRRRAWRWLLTQRFWTLGLALGEPQTDGSFGDPQGLGNLFLWPSLLIQLRGAQADACAPIFRKRCGCLHPSFYRLFGFKLEDCVVRSIAFIHRP